MKRNYTGIICASHLVLTVDNCVLLQRRANTGYEDGNYSLPSGHVEAGETVEDAVIRETMEEVGISLDRTRVRLSHVMHRRVPDEDGTSQERMDFFLTSDRWDGVPRILEPHKADDLRWFDLEALPANTIPYIREAIARSIASVPYSEFGWQSAA
jgi:8-oxo-dGTP pyrophosphatase MutT (NUDIX family)